MSRARRSASTLLRTKEIDGYIALPADILESGSIFFRARKGGSFEVIRDLRSAGTRAVQSERLARSGIDASAVAALVAPVTIDEARLTEQGEERGGALSTFVTAYVVAFLIYLMTTLYGVAVMRSVLEEKTNRIAEVLMSTIRASPLMAGKIIGVGSAAVVQVLIWVAITALVVNVSPRLGAGFSLPEFSVPVNGQRSRSWLDGSGLPESSGDLTAPHRAHKGHVVPDPRVRQLHRWIAWAAAGWALLKSCTGGPTLVDARSPSAMARAHWS